MNFYYLIKTWHARARGILKFSLSAIEYLVNSLACDFGLIGPDRLDQDTNWCFASQSDAYCMKFSPSWSDGMSSTSLNLPDETEIANHLIMTCPPHWRSLRCMEVPCSEVHHCILRILPECVHKGRPIPG